MRRVIAALCLFAVLPTVLLSAPSPVEARMDLPNHRFTERPEPFGSTAPLVCLNRTRPGSRAFGNLIDNASGYVAHVDPRRPCTRATSHHHSGRAVDVMIDYRVRAQREDGRTLKAWLFNNDGAMIKRLGIVEIIWADHIWTTARDSDNNVTANMRRWRDHASADCPRDGENICHYNHIHFSLSGRGSARDTTFWTARR